MRKILYGVLIFVGLLVAAGASLVLFADVNRFREPIAAQIQNRLQRPVSLGNMGLSLFPLSIRIQDFSIGDNPAFSSPKPFLAAKTLYVRVGLAALLNREVSIESLRLSGVDLELIKNPTGKWNFSGLGQSPTPATGSSAPPSLKELRIEDASVAVTDLAQRKPRTVYDHIDIALDGFAPNQPFHLAVHGRAYDRDLSLDTNGAWNSADRVLALTNLTAKSGDLAATGRAELRFANDSIDADLATQNAPLPELAKLAGAGDLAEAGTISFAAHAAGPLSDPALTGSGNLRAVRLKLPSLKKPLEVDSAKLRLDRDTVVMENVVAKLASSNLKGGVTVRNFTAPRLEFRLDADRIDLGELQQLAVTAPQPETRSATSTKPLSGTGTLSAGSLVYDQVTLTDVKAGCKLDSGIVRLDPVSAKTFGGETQGAITIDTRPGPGAYGLTVALHALDANQLLSATTSLKQVLFGLLAGDVDLSVRPKPGQNPARALNGKASIQLNNGRLAGVQILDQLASVAKLLGYTQRSEPFTNIVKLAGTMQIQDGVAQTQDLQMVIDGGSLTAAGTIDLAEQTIHMQLTSFLDKNVMPSADRSQIGGWMTTALANSKGQIVVPAIVTGTLKSPKFAPDPERMAKLKLQQLSSPQGITDTASQILGAFQGNKPAAQGQQKQQKQPSTTDTVMGILEGLTKKK